MKVFRTFFYPLARALDQLGDSSANLGRAVRGARVKVAALAVAGEACSPAERFEILYEKNGWSELELADQLKACRRAKAFAIGSSLSGFCMAIYMLLVAPVVFAFLLAPMGFFVLALGFVQTLKFTLYQEQLRRRSLITLKELLSDVNLAWVVFT